MRENVAARLDRADLAHILPEAHENSWYPESFLRPVGENQPRLDWALERLEDIRQLLANAGIADHHIVWLGFPQGACLVSEYVAPCSPPRLKSLVRRCPPQVPVRFVVAADDRRTIPCGHLGAPKNELVRAG
jgi:hypothetical protein